MVCFAIGFVVLKGLSLGLLKIDYSEGPGWNPISTMSDGNKAISDFTVSVVGFFVIMGVAGLVALLKQ
jgi:hypothetical protein